MKAFYTMLELITKNQEEIYIIRIFLSFIAYSEIMRKEKTGLKIKLLLFVWTEREPKLTQHFLIV